MFFYSINPYAIRLFATFILKILLYLRLLIIVESAAAFNFPPPFEPLMYGLDCRNNTFPHICRVSDSGVGNEGALSCRMLYNYVRHLRTLFLFDMRTASFAMKQMQILYLRVITYCQDVTKHLESKAAPMR